MGRLRTRLHTTHPTNPPEGGLTKPRPMVPIQGHIGASLIFSHILLSTSRSALAVNATRRQA